MKPAKAVNPFFLRETLYIEESEQLTRVAGVSFRSRHPDLGTCVSTSQLGIQAPILAHEAMRRAIQLVQEQIPPVLSQIHTPLMTTMRVQTHRSYMDTYI